MTDTGSEANPGDGPNGEELSPALAAAKESLAQWSLEPAAGESAQQAPAAAPNASGKQPSSGGRMYIFAGLAALVLLGGGLVYLAGFRGGDETEPSLAEESASEQVAEAEGSTASTSVDQSELDLPFEVGGQDSLGRPLPALPDELVENTANAGQLPGYADNPEEAPEVGPYSVIQNGLYFLRGSVSSENLRQHLLSVHLAQVPLEVTVVEFALDPEDPWYFGDAYPVFIEDQLLFPVGSTEINPDFLPLFQVGAGLLQDDPAILLEITGHTDSRGDDQSNLELSQARVDAVVELYVSLGTSREQLIAVGKGETEPIGDNATEEGRALNRRVELNLRREIPG